MKITIKGLIKPVNVMETIQDFRIDYLELEGELTEVQKVLKQLGLEEKNG